MSATSVGIARAPGASLTRHLVKGARRRPALAAAVVIGVLAWPLLIAIHPSQPPLPLARSVAIERLHTDPATAKTIAHLRWNKVVSSALGRRYEALWLFNGNHLVLTTVISAAGEVEYEASPVHQSYAYGSGIANDGRVLALLGVVFVLMSAVWPLRRIRNLDVAVCIGFVAAVVLMNLGLVSKAMLLSYCGLLYLAARCGWRAFGPARPARPSVPLYELVMRGWSAQQRRRVLRLALFACLLITAMVGLSSEQVVDVGYAVMEGATTLVHGILPYGHIPDVLHGDTYPIGSYLLYVPFAWLSPVRDEFDSADFTLLVAVAAAMLAAWGVWRATRRAAQESPRRSEAPAGDDTAGLCAAIALLTFPPLLVTVSTGTTDVMLGAILLGALLLWRRPGLCTTVLAAGAWFKLSPIALMPLSLARIRRGGVWRALAGTIGLSVAMVALLVGLGGTSGPAAMVHAMGYQATRWSLDSLWASVGSVPLQQLMQAATLALVAAATIQVRRDPGLANDRARIAALAAAVMIGTQMSTSYWSFMYLAWIYPALALSLLAPSPAGSLAARER